MTTIKIKDCAYPCIYEGVNNMVSNKGFLNLKRKCYEATATSHYVFHYGFLKQVETTIYI